LQSAKKHVPPVIKHKQAAREQLAKDFFGYSHQRRATLPKRKKRDSIKNLSQAYCRGEEFLTRLLEEPPRDLLLRGKQHHFRNDVRVEDDHSGLFNLAFRNWLSGRYLQLYAADRLHQLPDCLQQVFGLLFRPIERSFQNFSGFLFHGTPVLRRPNPELALGAFLELPNRDAGH
jgi:hypothetical protein